MSKGRAFLSAFTPSLMDYDILEAIFVQKRRHELANRLVCNVRESASTPTKRHTLLVGPRGIGKTHLITLVYHRLRSRAENVALDRQIRIAWLKEEERGVRSFGHLVRRILESLAAEYRDDALARQTEALLDSPQDFEEQAERLLTIWLTGKTLLLLAENFDDMLRRIGTQGQRRFRAYLQNENNTLLLVTTPSLTEELSAHEAPFYGFFNVETLLELQEEDTFALLQKIAEWRKDADLRAFLETPTAHSRLRVIEALAGGHPRIWILFAGVLTAETLDELVPLFQEMLDDLTPYYQARLDTLSPQQAQIIECLIAKRRSVPVWEIAHYCLMEPNSVSVQLRLLGEMGYVRNDRLGRVSYYELREPLMRLCLEVKESRGKPLQLIVDFLRRWYDREELEHRLALCRPDSRYERAHMEAALAQMPFLIAEDVRQKYIRYHALRENRQFEEALVLAEELVTERGKAYDWFNRGFCLSELHRYPEALASYDRALELESAVSSSWNNRGIVLYEMNRHQEALASYDKALELEPEDAGVWNNKGIALGGLNRFQEALESFECAIKIDASGVMAIFSKAELYLARGDWNGCLHTLQQGFGSTVETMTRYSWEAHGREMCRGLLRRSEDYMLWPERIEVWLELCRQFGVLAAVGMGMVRAISELSGPTVTDTIAVAWNAAWQTAGKGSEDLVIPLRLLDAAVRWRAKHDPAVLLSLPAEERPILKEIIGG